MITLSMGDKMKKNKKQKATIYRVNEVSFFDNLKQLFNIRLNFLDVAVKTPFFFLISLSMFLFISYNMSLNEGIDLVINSGAESLSEAISYSDSVKGFGVYFLPLVYIALFFMFFAYPYFKNGKKVNGVFIFLSPKFYFVSTSFFIFCFLMFWFWLSIFYNIVQFELPITSEQFKDWFVNLSILGKGLFFSYIFLAVFLFYFLSLSFYLLFYLNNIKKIGFIESVVFSISYLKKNLINFFINSVVVFLFVFSVFSLIDKVDYNILKYSLTFFVYIVLAKFLMEQSSSALLKKYVK